MGDRYPDLWSELQENISKEMVGLLSFLGGGFFLINLLNTTNSWLVRYMGWLAPWFALALIIFGAVLMLSQRAGYWSLEAVIGMQLLLLSLMTGTFILQNRVPDWVPHFDGSNGGLIGWTFGNLLISGFGRWPAFMLMFLTGLLGAAMLGRYTPLVYLFGRWQDRWPAVWQMLRQSWHEFAFVLRELVRRPNTDSAYYSDPGSNERADLPDFPRGNLDSSGYHEPPEEDSNLLSEGEEELTPNLAGTTRAERRRGSSPSPTRTTTPLNRGRGGNGGAPKPVRNSSELPSTDLLVGDSGEYVNAAEQELALRIEETLEDFNVPVRVVHIESGPTVTQFGVEPLFLERAGQRRRIRVNSIVKLADDLALALEAPAVRIEAPVPGKPYVGIEVPNIDKVMVNLRGLVESRQWRREGGILAMGLGRDTAGQPVIMDLARAPHMLIAGATGAGKSVCINTIIVSLLMQHGPESLRLIMVDPKMVELPGYNGIPHLLGKVITDTDHVMGMLTWLLLQMDDRYRTFKEVGARNIDTYNAKVRRLRKKDAPKPLPYIVLIIDELADLMMTAADDVERQICRLAQMARATGIHLILATQRPSTDVVTGLIKANFPTRIAFAVSSQIDSRVIMDTPGAERLLGRGDMLLMRSDAAKLQRVQGCFVSDDEINAIVGWWKEEHAAKTDAAEVTKRPVVAPWNSILDRMDEEDELIQDAIDVIRDLDSVSTSLIQRKLEIGYPKAARLMEVLEEREVVGPDRGGGRGRKVLFRGEEDENDSEDEVAEELFD